MIGPGEPWYSEYRETKHAVYRLSGDSLYFAYVDGSPDGSPDGWGFPFSDRLVSAIDLVRARW